MKKYFLILIILLSGLECIFGQKYFTLTIELEKHLDPKKVTCSYYNGQKNILVVDTFVNNILKVRDRFYVSFISFHIEYNESSLITYTNDFFISEKPAKINSLFKPDDKNGLLRYRSIYNAIPIYDTSANKLFRQLTKYRLKEAQSVSELWQKYGSEINNNDSLSLLNRQLFKKLNIKTIAFLKRYSQNYFAFWYFRTQVVEPSLTFLTSDTAYLSSLVNSLKTIFPSKYLENEEGQSMIKRISSIISPPRINTQAPLFNSTDIKGIQVTLSKFKNKYVLLDFWATWCPPCLKEIPFIKKIRNDYPQNKLEIISISSDRNMAELKRGIEKNEMNWTHILDEGNKIQNLFGVLAIPATILINNEGIIIYSSLEKKDENELIRLLQGM